MSVVNVCRCSFTDGQHAINCPYSPHQPLQLGAAVPAAPAVVVVPAIERRTVLFPPPTPTRQVRKLKDVEREEIEFALSTFGEDKKKAAEALGIALKTLYNKLVLIGYRKATKADVQAGRAAAEGRLIR